MTDEQKEAIKKARRAYQRAWLERNPDYQKKWREANPEKYAAAQERYWLKKATELQQAEQ